MKENVARPTRVVDINRLSLGRIEDIDGGGLRLGALATNADTAYDTRVQERYPLLSSAILAGASPQLRNAATNGGNLNQRTRCYYFYDTTTPCNKRERGSGCGAIGGVNRIHAILGASNQCIATHPSDMCVALAALQGEVRVRGPAGERTIALADYHRLPGDEPWRDNGLEPGELVTIIDLPVEGFPKNYTYLKLRDRLFYAFALVSVAVARKLEEGRIAEVRIALGGVAHKPWRRTEARAGDHQRVAVAGCLRPCGTRAVGRRSRSGRERLQDRPCPPRRHPRTRPSGRRHSSIANRQACRLKEKTMDTYSRIGIGTPLSRVDGVQKVTGQARYAAEYPAENLLYGVILSSAIAKGRIVAIDEDAARRVPGVIEIMTHKNRPHVAFTDHSYKDELSIPGSPFRPLYDDKIMFSQQPIGLVLAETFEAARYAASLIDGAVTYEAEPHNVDFDTSLSEKFLPRKKRSAFHPPKNRGDAERAFAEAPLKVDAEYGLATEHHNPMEMHASTVIWEGAGKLTVYDKTQGPQNVQGYLASAFGFSKKDVRVINAYVGGAFGSGLRPQHQVYLATTSTSRYEDNMEDVVIWGMINYACPDASGDYTVAPRDTATSGDMRAPGAATGITLFEIAIDEMAYLARSTRSISA